MAGNAIFCGCRGGEHIFKLCFSSLPQSGLLTVPIVRLGTYRQGDAIFAFRAEDVARLVQNFRKPGSDVPINYEQVHDWPNLVQKGTLPTAGWLKEIDQLPDKDGVLWGRAELSDEAKQMITIQGYEYLLPNIRWDLRDEGFRLQGMTLVSLTLVKNPPFLGTPPTFSETTVEQGEVNKTVFNDLDALNGFLADEATERAAQSGVSYAEALALIGRENPDLMKLRQAFRTAQATSAAGLRSFQRIDGQLRENERQVDTVVQAIRSGNPGLSQAEALTMAASEYVELFRERMRLRRLREGR